MMIQFKSIKIKINLIELQHNISPLMILITIKLFKVKIIRILDLLIITKLEIQIIKSMNSNYYKIKYKVYKRNKEVSQLLRLSNKLL
jgi:hypothetical protein